MKVPQSVLVFVLALAGCMKPNPLIYTLTLGDDDEADASDSETGDGDGDPGDGDPGDGDGDPGDGDPGDGDLDDGDPELQDMPGSESCEPLAPLAPLEIACGECLATGCCDLVLACADVDECLCLANCVLEGGSPGKCKNSCGGVQPGELDELGPLLACANAACDDAC
jgi:hypothetical protein